MPPTRRLVDGDAHRVGHVVGVHDDATAHVAGGAADGLDEATLVTQEALLIGIENRDEADLRQVEALAQQVDADEHVEAAHAQLAQDLDTLDRADVAMQIIRLHALVEEEIGELFGHLLGERGDEHALVTCDDLLDLGEQIVNLALGGT